VWSVNMVLANFISFRVFFMFFVSDFVVDVLKYCLMMRIALVAANQCRLGLRRKCFEQLLDRQRYCALSGVSCEPGDCVA